MRPEVATAALRPRTGFEAVDLGFEMLRTWWRPVFGAWLWIVAPIAALLIVALRDHPIACTALLWWLRPAFARVPLHVLARRLFGDPVRARDVAGALPALLRSAVVRSLFLERLSPYRTVTLPVLLLEGLRAREAGARGAVLVRRDASAAIAMVVMGAFATFSLVLGGILAVQLFVPPEIGWDVFELFLPAAADRDADPGAVLLPILYLASTSLVEPALTAGGFAVYLNRRIDLEGWDLEIALRGIARRLAAEPDARPAHAAARAWMLALGIGLALAGPAAPAHATACDPARPSTAGACAAEVLASEDFGSTREVRTFRLRSFETGDSFEGFTWLADLVAGLFEVGVWVALATGVIALLVALARSAKRREPRPAAAPPVLRVGGLELDPESLPPDLLAAARAAWARGAPAEALSLLYRGTLVALHDRRALEVPASATEGECLRAVERALPAEPAGVFETLTRQWMATRYAARPPTTEHFTALCRELRPLLVAPSLGTDGASQPPPHGVPSP